MGSGAGSGLSGDVSMSGTTELGVTSSAGAGCPSPVGAAGVADGPDGACTRATAAAAVDAASIGTAAASIATGVVDEWTTM